MKHFTLPGFTVRLFLLVGLALAQTGLATETAEITYEKHIRPILKTHCFHCHGEGGELSGGLDVRLNRLLVAGGDSGTAIVPGDPSTSLLSQRVANQEMPPAEIATRLSSSEISLIENWIQSGAPTARPEPTEIDLNNYITDEERSYWAFQPVRHPELPPVNDLNRVRNAIDRFLLSKLESHELSFAPDADKLTLIRRASFDLLGLPPEPAAIDQFVRDENPGAYERLIDRLLSTAQYGERWGRHWLDVAGYADSEGYTDDDPERLDAYKYRNYVIQAFNSDKPLDQFVIEQLAGDELVPQPFNNLTADDAEKLIATGFLRMAPDGTGAGGVDQSLARNEVVAKTLEIVSSSLLGLTVGCAQCHDHRYDPISQADYYSLRAIFEPALDWKQWTAPRQRHISLYTDADREQAAAIEAEALKVLADRSAKEAEFIEATFQRELAKLPESLRETVRIARNTPVKQRTAEQTKLLNQNPSVNVSAGSLYLYDKKAADVLKQLSDQANTIRATKPREEFVRAVWEPSGKQPPQTFLFHRGDHDQPKQELAPRELTVLTSWKPVELPINDANLSSSGRRLAYAKWLVSGEHPLVARVLVNRVWLNHFGQGLVPTAGDFGLLGVPPTHPELLDWLADELVASGWSLKHLHRLIMTSTAYRQVAQRHAAGEAIDADNVLYGRMPLRRLEAEIVRDASLALSGELDLRLLGGVVPVMADRVGQFVIGKENLNAGRPGAVIDMGADEFRRSIYIQVRRSRPLSLLAPFDLPRMEPNCTVRQASTVSPQSLVLMNSDFAIARATRFAQRVHDEAGEQLVPQITLAWQLAFGSVPTTDELKEASAFIAAQTEHFAAHPAAESKDTERLTPQGEALASFCHALLSSNRFLYVD